jgi:hypothetical protein
MRDTRLGLLLSLLLLATNVFAFSISDIPWASSLEAAKAKAKSENKPILLLHVFGFLDQEFT